MPSPFSPSSPWSVLAESRRTTTFLPRLAACDSHFGTVDPVKMEDEASARSELLLARIVKCKISKIQRSTELTIIRVK